MTTSPEIKILPEELIQIVDAVFTTMMGLPVTASNAAWHSGPDRFTSAVYVAGEWNGAVLLECDRSMLCRLAGRFLSMDAPEAVDDDVRDVFGELANMVGGNLKCVLSSGLKLSMPSVVEGSDHALRICKAEIQDRVSLECEEGVFWVFVVSTRE